MRPPVEAKQRSFNALPGFRLTVGFTLVYLSAIVLIPFAGLVIRALGLSWADFWLSLGVDTVGELRCLY